MLSFFLVYFSDIFVKFYIVEICLISWYYNISKKTNYADTNEAGIGSHEAA